MSKPGRADLNSANLTPASGRQDHTTSPYAATSFVRSLGDRSRTSSTRPAIPSPAKRCRVHRIPPRVRDDREPPLMWDETTGDIEVIWVSGEQYYSCERDSTDHSSASPSGKSRPQHRVVGAQALIEALAIQQIN